MEMTRDLEKHHSRGLASLRRRVGNIDALVGDKIRLNKPVRVLEVGCGLGCALMELAAITDGHLEIYGHNRDAADGSDTLRASLLPEARTQHSIHWSFGDAGERLPFDDGFFDVIFSQFCLMYVADKIRCLSEIARVLRVEGEARIDNFIRYQNDRHPELVIPEAYSNWLQFCDGTRAVDAPSVLSCLPGLGLFQGIDAPYMVVKSSFIYPPSFTLISSTRLESVDPRWFGTRSIYSKVRNRNRV